MKYAKSLLQEKPMTAIRKIATAICFFSTFVCDIGNSVLLNCKIDGSSKGKTSSPLEFKLQVAVRYRLNQEIESATKVASYSKDKPKKGELQALNQKLNLLALPLIGRPVTDDSYAPEHRVRTPLFYTRMGPFSEISPFTSVPSQALWTTVKLQTVGTKKHLQGYFNIRPQILILQNYVEEKRMIDYVEDKSHFKFNQVSHFIVSEDKVSSKLRDPGVYTLGPDNSLIRNFKINLSCKNN